MSKKPNADRIRGLREARGWPQEQLATIAGISDRTVQRMEAGQSVSAEALRAVAAAFDADISELLATAAPSPPLPKVTVLARARSGEHLCNIVGGADMYQQDHEGPKSQDEVDLIGAFLQQVHDVGEIWDDIEPSHHVQWAYDLGASLADLERAGFRVFAGRVARKYQFGIEKSQPVTMSVATVVVMRSGNAKILFS